MREAIPPFPQYVFMAWCLVKHRDNVTFYLYLTFMISVRRTYFQILIPTIDFNEIWHERYRTGGNRNLELFNSLQCVKT
jgi:hypothetical protein